MKTMLQHCILMAIAIIGMSAYAQKPNDWANHQRYAHANSALTESPRVVMMGNSITDFWPDRSPEFWAAHPEFCGRGISGQTSAQMLCRFRADVIDLHPQIVVILAGTNDIAQNQGYISLPHIVDNIMSMVDLARAHDIKVVVSTLPPADSFNWRKEINPPHLILELNAMITEAVTSMADPGVVLVDYYTPLADPSGALPAELGLDSCHPNGAGYRIMEAALLSALQSF